jgi:hypothetical protein
VTDDPRVTRARYVYDVTIAGCGDNLPDELDKLLLALSFIKSIEPNYQADEVGQGQFRLDFVASNMWTAKQAEMIIHQFFAKECDVHTTLVESTRLGAA